MSRRRLRRMGALPIGLFGTCLVLSVSSNVAAQTVTGASTTIAELRSTTTDLVGSASSAVPTVGGLRASLLGLDLPDPIDPTDPASLANLAATINRQGAAIDLTARDLDLLRLRLGTGGDVNNDHEARLRVHQQRLDQQDDTKERQDDRLDDHDARLRRTETANASQDQELDDHSDQLGRHETRLNEHEKRIASNTQLVETMQSNMLNQLANLEDELQDHDRRIDKATSGVAMALAMKSPSVPDDKNFALSGSFGAFEGRTALALAAGVRATDSLQFDAGVAIGLDQGSVGGRAGATLAW